jgi:hypothetical protein
VSVIARSARAPRRTRRPILVAAVVVLVGSALAAARLGAGTTPLPAPRERPSAPRPTEKAAVRLAVSALYALSVPAILDRARFESAVARLAAPGYERKVSAAFGATGAELAVSFRGEPRVLRSAPLGYRVVRFTQRDASIAIWSVAIAASRGFEADAQWRTVVIDLVWTSSGWRVSGGSGTEGPDPTTPLDELAIEASSFRSLTHVP